jgi:hypothetical protein
MSAGGWVRTFLVNTSKRELHLVQHRGIFYRDASDPEAANLSDRKRNGMKPAPQWKSRSNRGWPEIAGLPLQFVGQHTGVDSEFYVFSSPNTGIYIFDEALGLQDPEDHYDSEE